MCKRILSVALLVLACSCVPVVEETQAERAPLEQSKHSIRVLQKTDIDWTSILIVEVDGQEYIIARIQQGIAICKK